MSAIILAGGKGSRFFEKTGRYKLLYPLADGRSMLRVVCQNALSVLNDVVVVVWHHRDAVTAILDDLPVRVIPCPTATQGPGATIKAGVQAVSARRHFMIFLGDMPFISRSTVQAVEQKLLEEGSRRLSIVRPWYDDKPGHPVGFSAGWRRALLELDDSTGANTLIRANLSSLHQLSIGDPGCIRDVDTISDLDSNPTQNSM